MSARHSTIQVRMSADRIESVPMADALLRLFKSAIPWREFRWYKGQRHLLRQPDRDAAIAFANLSVVVIRAQETTTDPGAVDRSPSSTANADVSESVT